MGDAGSAKSPPENGKETIREPSSQSQSMTYIKTGQEQIRTPPANTKLDWDLWEGATSRCKHKRPSSAEHIICVTMRKSCKLPHRHPHRSVKPTTKKCAPLSQDKLKRSTIGSSALPCILVWCRGRTGATNQLQQAGSIWCVSIRKWYQNEHHQEDPAWPRKWEVMKERDSNDNGVTITRCISSKDAKIRHDGNCLRVPNANEWKIGNKNKEY